MIDLILVILAIIVLTAGSYTDMKIREVPDWISYGFIFAALGTRLLYTIFTKQPVYFIEGLLGFGLFFAIANLFYFLRQWGGGDAKISMGIGAVLGLNIFNSISYMMFLLFILLLIFIGAVFGLIYSISLAVKNKSKFNKAFNRNLNNFKLLEIFAIILFIAGLLITIFSIFDFALLLLAISTIFLIGVLAFIFTKAVEESCFINKVKASNLTEGDWVAETIKINGKTIIKEDNLGITKAQLARLKYYRKPILVKTGIPFVPSFLLAFLVFTWVKSHILTLI